VHGLVLLQGCILPLCVAPELDDLALASQPPLPEKKAAQHKAWARSVSAQAWLPSVWSLPHHEQQSAVGMNKSCGVAAAGTAMLPT
jgi:hypothetical protein